MERLGKGGDSCSPVMRETTLVNAGWVGGIPLTMASAGVTCD